MYISLYSLYLKYSSAFPVVVKKHYKNQEHRRFLYITETRLFKYIENFTTKDENFQMKNSEILHISAQNIDCGYLLEPQRGGSNGYPQSMILSRNKKINVYPCKPQFYCIKVGFKGVKLYRRVFRDDINSLIELYICYRKMAEKRIACLIKQ